MAARLYRLSRAGEVLLNNFKFTDILIF